MEDAVERDMDLNIITPPVPFYGHAKVYVDDDDVQSADHSDSPGEGFSWENPESEAGAPELLGVSFYEAFRAWLVVQNIEWRSHDVPGSFAYQKYFDWWAKFAARVNTSQPVDHRFMPQSSPPHVGPMKDGKGSKPGMPVLDGQLANKSRRESKEHGDFRHVNPLNP
jgi:hypothetical protein